MQFNYQSYLTFLWHGENSPNDDVQYEYCYDIRFFAPKRHENFNFRFTKVNLKF